MDANFPLHRFEEFGSLNARERSMLREIAGPAVRYVRRATVRPEGVAPLGFYLLAEGWVAAARTLPDGGRQILKVHLPGDAVGTPSMCMSKTVEEIVCLTDATVLRVSFQAFSRLIECHPRMGFRFMLSVQRERVALMDRLASIGRTSAEAQVAALLLDLTERLRPLGLVRDERFSMLMTQEQMADLLGMTAVHINRTIRRLEKYGMIERQGSTYAILDTAGLKRLTSDRDRVPMTDFSWMPAER